MSTTTTLLLAELGMLYFPCAARKLEVEMGFTYGWMVFDEWWTLTTVLGFSSEDGHRQGFLNHIVSSIVEHANETENMIEVPRR